MRTLLTLIIGAALGAVSTPALAAEEAADAHWRFETLPPELALRVKRQEDGFKQLGLHEAPKGVYSSLKIWPPTYNVLRVCFLGGSQERRVQIAKYASEWNEVSMRLKLDFGLMDNPRVCNPNENAINHIRVSFDKPGYWSMVGQNSLNLAVQLEASLNLEVGSPGTELEFAL